MCEVDHKDLSVEVLKCGGVKVVHVPTGIAEVCKNHGNPYLNRYHAVKNVTKNAKWKIKANETKEHYLFGA